MNNQLIQPIVIDPELIQQYLREQHYMILDKDEMNTFFRNMRDDLLEFIHNETQKHIFKAVENEDIPF